MNARVIKLGALAVFLWAAAVGRGADEEYLKNWPQWRGPLAGGLAPLADPPTEWSETKNVRWKVAVPGEGSSTPIVWGDRVFLLTAVETDRVAADLPAPADQPKRLFGIVFPNKYHQFTVVCLDRTTGKTLWAQVAADLVPHEGRHPDNDFASATPVTDGRHLFVSFGSRGLYCFDLDGNLQWKQDLGQLQTRRSFGEGSSPALHDGVLVTTWDHDGPSFIVAHEATTGKELWRQERDEVSAWATPIIVTEQDRTQVITNASKRVRSYDLKTGELLWECGGQVGNVTPSPVANEKLVFCMSGYRGSALFALPLDQSGDLTDSDKIAWKKGRGTPYVPSPLLYGNRLYFTQSNDGILSCLDANTGTELIERSRLPGISRVYASHVGAAGRVYVTSRDGVTLVIRNGDALEVLATNRLDDDFDASAAIAGKQLFLRGRKSLYCLEDM